MTRLDRVMGEIREGEAQLKETRAEKRVQDKRPAVNDAPTPTYDEPARDTELAPAHTNNDMDPDLNQILVAISHNSDLEPLPMNEEEEPRTWKEAKSC